MGVLRRFQVDDKVVVVSDVSSTIGRAAAVAVTEAGARVIVGVRAGVRADERPPIVDDTGQLVPHVDVDILHEESCAALMEAAVADYERVDILINTVAALDERDGGGATGVGFSSLMDLSLSGTFLMARAAAARMKPGSSIVNVALARSLESGAEHTDYGGGHAASEGVLGLSRDLASQWREDGIRVNAILAAVSPQNPSAAIPSSDPQSSLSVGGPADVATIAVFLASEASTALSGVGLRVSYTGELS
jgi:NAD(P)-dependent dehydrogenase (short-subunit alcohol dehydrogenase family)